MLINAAAFAHSSTGVEACEATKLIVAPQPGHKIRLSAIQIHIFKS